MAGADRMTIEQVVRKVLVEDHADVVRESGRWVAEQLMEAEVSELTGTSRTRRRRLRAWCVMSASRRSPALFDSDDAWRGLLGHGDSIEPHFHRSGQLVYPASGLLVTTTDRGTWATPADQIAWTPPGFAHTHRTYGVTDIRLMDVPDGRCAELPDRPGIFPVSPLLREALLSLTGGRELADGPRDRLREVVVDELVALPEQPLHLPEPVDDRLRAATARLHERPGTPATLAELGREAGASERTLSRLFRSELGMSFHQWRTRLRVQRALILLAQGLSVTETAIELGWANPTSFIEAFRAVVGETPGRYASAGRASRREG